MNNELKKAKKSLKNCQKMFNDCPDEINKIMLGHWKYRVETLEKF